MAKRKTSVKSAKEALRVAHAEWANNGLIPYTNGPNVGSSIDFMAMRFMDSYRGKYPSAFRSGTDIADEFVGNLLFSIINTVVAQTSAQDPEPIIRPLGGTAADDKAWRRAWLNQKLVTAFIREKNFRREIDRAFLSSLLLPFGIVRHGYTPEVEYEEDGVTFARFKNQTPDLPWVQFLRPWQVRMDPLVNNFDMDGEVGWIAFQNIYRSKQELEMNGALINTDIWKPTYHYDLRPYHERNKPRVTGSALIGQKKQEDSISMYEEWVVYNASTRTYYGVSDGCEKFVRAEKDWPLEWGQLPASILTINEQLDSPFGIPFPRMIWNEAILYNKVWTIIQLLINRTRRVLFVNSGAFTQNQASLDNFLLPDSMVEAVLSDGDVDKVVKEVAVGQLDGQLIGLIYQLKELMWEILGVSNFDRGQRANVQTAAEAAQIGAGSQMSKSRIQSKFESFWVNNIKVAHRAVLNTEDERPFIVPLLGQENFTFLTEPEVQQGFVKATLAELNGEFDYGVKLNSTTPIDPGAELAKFGAALQMTTMVGQNPLVQPVPALNRIFSLAGEDSEKLVMPQKGAEMMGQNPEQGEQAPGLGAALNPSDAGALANVTSGGGQ